MTKAWSILEAEVAEYLTSSRLDFCVWLEECNTPPPVAFKNRNHLVNWIQQIGNMTVVPFGRKGRAFRVHGYLSSGSYYDQIWAAKGYRGYRRLMLRQASDGFGVAKTDMVGIDADHVIARTMLKNLPHAWVAIFPVPAGANRPFGRIEKRLPKLSPMLSRVDLSPISAFKLLCGHLPETHSELQSAMLDVRGQVINQHASVALFLDTMERQISQYLR